MSKKINTSPLSSLCPGQSKGYDGYAAPVNIESEPPSPEVIDLEQHLTSYELNPCDPLNNPCVNTRQSMCEVSDNNEDRSANMDLEALYECGAPDCSHPGRFNSQWELEDQELE